MMSSSSSIDLTCVICGLNLNPAEHNRLRQSRRATARKSKSIPGTLDLESVQEPLLGHWKADCAQSLIEILFGQEKHGLLGYFKKSAGYCPSCLQNVRDIDFNLRKIKSLVSQLDILSIDVRNLIEINYATIVQKSDEEDVKTRLSLLTQDENLVEDYSNKQILEMIHSDMSHDGQNLLKVVNQIVTVKRHSSLPDKVAAISVLSDENEGNGDVDLETSIVTNTADLTCDDVLYESSFEMDEYSDSEIVNETAVEIEDNTGHSHNHDISGTTGNISGQSHGVDASDQEILMELEDAISASDELMNTALEVEDSVEGNPESLKTGEESTSSGFNKCQNVKVKIKSTIPKVIAPNKHVCRFCCQDFKGQQELHSHLSSVHSFSVKEMDPYTCKICKMVCSNDIVLSLHTKKCHSSSSNSNRLHRCDLCSDGVLFSTFEDLQNHKEDTHSNKCLICPEKFSTAANLKSHMNTTHNSGYFYMSDGEIKTDIAVTPITLQVFERCETPHSCKVCGKSFTTLRLLQNHEQVHTGEKPHECEVCGKGFSKIYDFRKHLSAHTGEGPYKCDACNLSFPTSDEFRSHERSHTGKREYPCPHCSKKYATRYQLKLHLKSHSKKTKNTVKCEHCGRLVKASYLKKHLKNHSNEKNHPCNICDEVFSAPKMLAEHLKTHDEKKNYHCDICGKVYLNLEDLNTHSDCHAAERPFKCDFCNKRLKTAAAKRSHELSHKGNKSHQCETCGKHFSQSGNFKNHMRIHTGEKPFECQICGKRFTERGTWKEHIRIHTGEKPYSCGFCGKSFAQHRAANRHRKTHIAVI